MCFVKDQAMQSVAATKAVAARARIWQGDNGEGEGPTKRP